VFDFLDREELASHGGDLTRQLACERADVYGSRMLRTTVDAETLYRELHRVVGERRLAVEDHEVAPYARDMWPRLLLSVRDGTPLPYRPHAVVWPESDREVVAIVRVARALAIPIVPYGGGSGVCGGAVPLRGGITVDTKRMDQILSLERSEMLCDVEAGANGERFERELGRRGYTAGHFPSSIYCSTVGGWLACRAAGQMSTKYGKIEDRVAGLTMVTGRGDLVRSEEFARAQRGPNWTQLVVGSEGTLGIITSARIRVAHAPALRLLRGFEFRDVSHGVEAIRRVMQRGLRPAVVRLYDPFEAFMHLSSSGRQPGGDADPHRFGPTPERGGGALPRLPGREDARPRGLLSRAVGLFGPEGALPESLRREAMAAALSRPRLFNLMASQFAEKVSRSGCLLVVGLEGAAIRTEVESRLTFGELERAGGLDLGEDPGRHWFERRYAVSYGMSPVFRDGAFVDTMEVAAAWERLLDLYKSVREAISRHALVMAHFSHAYPDGCSIYFTFVGHADGRREEERLYDTIWREGLAAVSRAGGTISHHHGIGLLKSAWMSTEHREAMAILRALKRSFDPDGIMNPGKLGLSGGKG
jgi:alkyldihydroxyacetonephosphate synthase